MPFVKQCLFPVLILPIFVLCSEARAQQDCIGNLSIDATKSVAFLSIDNGADRITTAMSCTAAELLREQIFTSGHFDAKLFDDAQLLRTKLVGAREALASANAKLQAAHDRASREAILKAVKTPLATAAAAYSTIGCFLKKSTKVCATALASLAALWESLNNLPPADDLAKVANQTRSEIPIIQASIQEFEGALDQNTVQQSKLKYNAMFVAMCSSVKQQCSLPKK